MTNASSRSCDAIRVLLVDDEPLYLETLERIFRRDGLSVRTATSAEAALESLEQAPVDVVVTDIVMPGLSGVELIEKVKAFPESPEVVLLTGHATVDTAVQAMKLGAYDYLTKPASVPDLDRVIRKAYERIQLKRENTVLRKRLDRHDPYVDMIGSSKELSEVRDLVGRVAPTRSTVLVLGESGVGKELVARMVHQRSPRAGGPFLTLNCGAVQGTLVANELFGHVAGAYTGATKGAPGLFEAATQGTLFIDEIGEMSLEVQKSFLRVLEAGEFKRVGEARTRTTEARIVAATHRNLSEDVEAGRFRQDLYYRLNVFTVEVPPLRERASDLPELVHFFLKRLEPDRDKPRALSHEALAAVKAYGWPGNVRELKNALERGVIMARGEDIELTDLPPLRGPTGPGAPRAPRSAPPSPASSTGASPGGDPAAVRPLDELEYEEIVKALELTDGNKTEAARLLAVSVRSLYTRMKRHGLM
ncbi:MAG: sigma-54-dependent transcriptional regulator [Planctomycetota bacterium]|jgi:DNA-binding NtrC family response regulator